MAARDAENSPAQCPAVMLPLGLLGRLWNVADVILVRAGDGEGPGHAAVSRGMSGRRVCACPYRVVKGKRKRGESVDAFMSSCLSVFVKLAGRPLHCVSIQCDVLQLNSAAVPFLLNIVREAFI